MSVRTATRFHRHTPPSRQTPRPRLSSFPPCSSTVLQHHRNGGIHCPARDSRNTARGNPACPTPTNGVKAQDSPTRQHLLPVLPAVPPKLKNAKHCVQKHPQKSSQNPHHSPHSLLSLNLLLRDLRQRHCHHAANGCVTCRCKATFLPSAGHYSSFRRRTSTTTDSWPTAYWPKSSERYRRNCW